VSDQKLTVSRENCNTLTADCNHQHLIAEYRTLIDDQEKKIQRRDDVILKTYETEKEYRNKLDSLTSEQNRLKQALRKFGSHESGCDRYSARTVASDTKPTSCTCGLNAAIGDEGKESK